MPAAPLSPRDDEDREDFMDRCEDEGFETNECAVAWNERQPPAMVHKTRTSQTNGLEFVLSDETPDRMGDIIRADGWDTRNFKRNPVALFAHSPFFVVGTWENLRIDG